MCDFFNNTHQTQRVMTRSVTDKQTQSPQSVNLSIPQVYTGIGDYQILLIGLDVQCFDRNNIIDFHVLISITLTSSQGNI